jgi:hypothetical protein
MAREPALDLAQVGGQVVGESEPPHADALGPKPHEVEGRLRERVRARARGLEVLAARFTRRPAPQAP